MYNKVKKDLMASYSSGLCDILVTYNSSLIKVLHYKVAMFWNKCTKCHPAGCLSQWVM